MKIIMITLLFISTIFANVKVGDDFPTFKLVDQFDNNIEVTKNGDSRLILSFEKDVSSTIKKYLNSKNKTFLDDNNILYISDISSMPSFITSWFALPKMKKFNFKIALIYEDEVGDIIPREEDKITVIKLTDNNVTSIDFVEANTLDTILNLK